MKNLKYQTITILCLLVVGLIFACNSKVSNADKISSEPELVSEETMVMRGEYLVNIMGCHDCHSPKRMGEKGPEVIPDLMLSGYPQNRPIPSFDFDVTEKGYSIMNPDLTAAAGPWGISFAGNLTPAKSGLGKWTEKQFKNAITRGKYKGMEGGRMLLPPMPWFNYKELKEEDIKAIYKYLKTIKPVENIVPNPIPVAQISF